MSTDGHELDLAGMGKRIRERREARRLDRDALADFIGVSRTALYSWETGQKVPRLGNLKRLAKELHTTVAYLYGTTSDPYPCATLQSSSFFSSPPTKVKLSPPRS